MPYQDTANKRTRVDCCVSCFKLVALAIGLFVLQPSIAFSLQDAEDAQFQQKVQPILVSKCYPCHGPKIQKSGYRLDVREIAIRGGDHGEAAIVRGDSSASPIVRYVSDLNSEMAMPPKDSQLARLSEEEIAIVINWIDAGAKWPDSANIAISNPLDWWSFQPLAKTTPPSATSNPIDAFVVAKLAANGLTMSPAADARTLGRRPLLRFDWTAPRTRSARRIRTCVHARY